jgi:hypothetical protein
VLQLLLGVLPRWLLLPLLLLLLLLPLHLKILLLMLLPLSLLLLRLLLLKGLSFALCFPLHLGSPSSHYPTAAVVTCPLCTKHIAIDS